jgi:hypothetical protein
MEDVSNSEDKSQYKFERDGTKLCSTQISYNHYDTETALYTVHFKPITIFPSLRFVNVNVT